MDFSGLFHLCHSRYVSKVGCCFYISSMGYWKRSVKSSCSIRSFLLLSNPYTSSMLPFMFIQLSFKIMRTFLLYSFIFLRLDVSLSEFCGASSYDVLPFTETRWDDCTTRVLHWMAINSLEEIGEEGEVVEWPCVLGGVLS